MIGTVAAACATPFGLVGWPLAVVVLGIAVCIAYVLGRWLG